MPFICPKRSDSRAVPLFMVLLLLKISLVGVAIVTSMHPQQANCCLVQLEEADEAAREVIDKSKPRSEGYQRAVNIKLTGPIDDRMWQYFKSRVRRARKSRADLVVFEIDSPGGYLIQSLDIAESIRDIDWAYTVAHIPREAISGAAIISLGADEIVMAPDGRIGDVGAIFADPQLMAFRYVPAKPMSVLVRRARDLATAKRRSADLAESMIDKNLVLYYREGAGELPEFSKVRLTENQQNPGELAQAAGIDLTQWTLLEASGAERFLTLNGQMAVQFGLASRILQSRQALSREFNVSGAWTDHEINFTDKIVYWLNAPLFTGILLFVGLVALYVELSAPGVGIGGMIALVCALLFFWSRFMGGTSDWLEVLLFMIGVAFLLLEMFVIPGWGICGFTGLALLAASVILASLDFVIPQDQREWRQVLTNSAVLVGAGLSFMIAAGVITHRLGSIPIFNRLVLAPPSKEATKTESSAKSDSEKSDNTPHPMVSVGDWGVAESPLRPAGRVQFDHRSVDVVSDGAFIEPGGQVKVVEIRGNRIVVTECQKDELAETVWKQGGGDS